MDQAATTMDWPVGAVGPRSRPIWPVQSAAGPPVLGSGWSVHGQVHRGLDSGPNAWSISQSIDPVEGPGAVSESVRNDLSAVDRDDAIDLKVQPAAGPPKNT